MSVPAASSATREGAPRLMTVAAGMAARKAMSCQPGSAGSGTSTVVRVPARSGGFSAESLASSKSGGAAACSARAGTVNQNAMPISSA